MPFAGSLGGGYIGRVRFLLAAVLLAAVLSLGACGDEDSTGATVIPAAGEYAQTDATTPGVPADASYDLTAAEWNDLPSDERLDSVADYVADNEDVCGDSDPARVRDYADVSAGTDYPLTSPVAELLAEGCAAVVQSGGG